MIEIGSRVRFVNMPDDPESKRLEGVTGEVIYPAEQQGWVVCLDVHVLGHPSGKAWARVNELEEVEDVCTCNGDPAHPWHEHEIPE